MSQFCGKCDFCDVLSMGHVDFDKSEFYMYINNRRHKLDINNKHDAIKYYPYLISSMGGSKNGRYCIVLTSESFIDREEQERLDWEVRDILAYWEKCKRKKIPFDEEEAMKNIAFSNAVTREIIERVQVLGDKTTTEGLHTSIHEYYRHKWYEEMINDGYDKKEAFSWVYKEWLPTDEMIETRLSQ